MMKSEIYDQETARLIAAVEKLAPAAEVISINRPPTSRKQRRAMQSAEQRFRKRAVSHQCVLNRDCLTAGVQVYVDNEIEYHKFHSARGEETCKACPVCEKFRDAKRSPTKFTAAERAAIELEWRGRIEHAKRIQEQGPGVAALMMFMRRMNKALSVGRVDSRPAPERTA